MTGHGRRVTPLPEEEWDDEVRELLAPVLDPRYATPNIFLTLVRHRDVFRTWLPFALTLLRGGTLPGRDRELLILRTARRCGADYEWGRHVPIARKAGVSEDEIAAIRDDEGVAWTPLDAALLAAADGLHGSGHVPAEAWAVLAEHYSDEQLIEVPMVVGHYHMVAFTLAALGVSLEERYDGLRPDGGVR